MESCEKVFLQLTLYTPEANYASCQNDRQDIETSPKNAIEIDFQCSKVLKYCAFPHLRIQQSSFVKAVNIGNSYSMSKPKPLVNHIHAHSIILPTPTSLAQQDAQHSTPHQPPIPAH